jgi:hypothetical protein
MKQIIEKSLLYASGILIVLFQIPFGASTAEIILVSIATVPAFISILDRNRQDIDSRSAEKVLEFELDRHNPYVRYG